MPEESTTYIDTPRGIFYASGLWFHTTEEQLREYAGEVLAYEGLEELLDEAATWLRSGRAVVIWGLLGALLMVPPIAAAVSALLVYIGWELVGPSLVNRPMVQAFRLLERPGVQMAGYLLGLSFLAQLGAYWSVAAGLAGFILVRWDLLPRLLTPLIMRLRRLLYTVPAADHVLRLVILRAAMKYDVSQPDIDRMKEDVLRMMRRFD